MDGSWNEKLTYCFGLFNGHYRLELIRGIHSAAVGERLNCHCLLAYLISCLCLCQLLFPGRVEGLIRILGRSNLSIQFILSVGIDVLISVYTDWFLHYLRINPNDYHRHN